MQAAWYERRGPADEVLVVGELPVPEPGEGEVRIALDVSGINPGDVKKRAGTPRSPMPFPRVIPHSDGAGVIDAVGPGADSNRIGRPAWCYGAQSYRPFGTAAEYVVVPSGLAIDLPALGTDSAQRRLAEQAACIGIAGITAHRAIFADGPIDGLNVLVHGATGGVGSIATQLARRHGAQVIAVVHPEREAAAQALGAHHTFASTDPDLVERILSAAPEGVHRIAEVDLADHIALDAAIIAPGAVISSYYSSHPTPTIPYWTLGFADATIRFLGSDAFPPAVKADAAHTLTRALVDGELKSNIVTRTPLQNIVQAHRAVESRPGGRVVLTITRARGEGSATPDPRQHGADDGC